MVLLKYADGKIIHFKLEIMHVQHESITHFDNNDKLIQTKYL